MEYESNGNEFPTINTIGDEVVFVEEVSEVTVQEQIKRKKLKNNNRSVLRKEEDIETWVNEKASTDCIKFFKPQFCISPKYPELGLDVYFLLLMTKPQIEFMKKFSDRLVCVDRQKGENFEIVSLLTLDNREECLPCAFLFTNKITLEVFKVFFTEIKNIVGRVETKLVLTDTFEEIANIWEEVMETKNVKHMICSWDTLKDWGCNLLTMETQEKVDNSYKELEQLLQEKDINVFSTKCEALLDQLLSDPDTEEFGAYFAENYASHPQTWACCYRYEEEDSRGYYQLEKVHSTIQYILNTNSTKKLCKAIDLSLDFLRNKFYDRLILINNGKVSSKLAEIRQRHKVAEKMVYEIAHQNDYWTVTSRKKEQNVVTLCKGICDCQTKCLDCNVCTHTYVCSCIDSVLKLNMCRHIHSVCMSEAAGTTLEYGEVIGEQRFGALNSPLIVGPKVKYNDSLAQVSTKKTSKLNQICKKNNKTKLFYSSDSIIRGERTELAEEDSASVNEQIVQSDLLEVIGHEVLISNQEETYGDAHIVYEMDNEVEVIDQSDQEENQNFNASAVDRNQALHLRKTNIEQAFKTILNDVQSEDHLCKVENAVSLLKNDIKCSSSSVELNLRKRTYNKSVNSENEPLKISKLVSAGGKSLMLRNSVLYKLA